jgi:xanthine dehydrogenase accessory factor
MLNNMDGKRNGRNIYFKTLELLRQNKTCVLCTVTGTQGAAPQKPGSSALFDKSRPVWGTIGGGAVEHAIQQKVAEAIGTQASGHYFFDLINDDPDDGDTGCGGGMSILLDAAPGEHFSLFSEIQEDIKKGISGVLITAIKTGRQGETNIRRMWATQKDANNGLHGLTGSVAEALKNMLHNPVQDDFREFVVKQSGAKVKQVILLETLAPLAKLLIAGAGHVGKALSHLAKLIDFEVIVWDDRKELANQQNFPDADKILTGRMDRKPRNFKAGRNTFIVIATSSHQSDAALLKNFIRSGAGYIGMIGGKKKMAQIKRKFLENGWAIQEEWEKIYAPVGLEIHSKTVSEIAMSIAAQLIQVRYELNHNEQ